MSPSCFSLTKFAIACILGFFYFSNVSSQSEFRFGLNIHPNFTFSNIHDKSNFDSKYFTNRNGLVGFNLGLTTNYQKDKWIFEISSGLNSNKTGIKFKREPYQSQLMLKTLSFTNEFSFGYQVYNSDQPYYEIFILPNVSYSLTEIQEEGGNSNFQNVSEYQEIYVNQSWNSINIGIGIKIRTQLKNQIKFDYGLSYRYSLTKYPEFGMIIKTNGETFQALVTPNIQTLNIDFIYYFGKNKKKKRKKSS